MLTVFINFKIIPDFFSDEIKMGRPIFVRFNIKRADQGLPLRRSNPDFVVQAPLQLESVMENLQGKGYLLFRDKA